MRKVSPALYSSIALLLLWEGLARYLGMLYILPWPTAILRKIWLLREPIFGTHLLATLNIAMLSLVLSLCLGSILAICMDRSSVLEESLYPILVTSQTVPITALAPVFILWFGYSLWSKVLVAVLVAFFPLTITLHDGLRSTSKEYIDLLRSMGASDWDIFWKLKFPSSLPYLFSALKITLPLVFVGAAIGEWLGADAGLGYFSKRMMTQLDGAGVFAPIVVLSVLAIVLVQGLTVIEKKVLKWRK